MNPAEPCKVLLLYGYGPIARLLASILNQDCGDEVKIATTFEEGMQLIEGWTPDLIISQHDLFKSALSTFGSNGLKETPFLLIYPSDLFYENEEGEGVNWLAHPFNPKDLIAAREAVLQGKTYKNGLAG